MSVAKVKTSNGNGVLRLEDGNATDPLDTFLKQSIGRDPLLSLSRASDRPVQWIQYLQGFDQPELPGWPLLSPVKVPMQKCDKCSREFFSPINCRRHIRVQHRLKKLDKDTAKNRELLGTFWAQLSAEESREILSLKGAALEGIDEDKIITNLASIIQKSGFSVLPKTCMRAGSALLDLIQARSSNLPPSEEELFSILDDASETTFLCGPAMSMQKYIFDGEAAKIGLETKNLVAFISFLLEQKLIKAWIADKDAEALRCQQLLMEEEEAAQRKYAVPHKQAEILERKRRKKLRQKAKEQKEEQCPIHENPESSTPPAESSANVITMLDSETPFDAAENRVPPSAETMSSSTEHELEISESRLAEGLRIDPNLSLAKSSHTSSRVECNHGRNDTRVASMMNGSKSWSWKKKNENSEDYGRSNNKQEVLIGSISVTIECDDTTSQLHDFNEPSDNVGKEHGTQKKKMYGKSENFQYSSMNRPMGKFWRPVSRQGTRDGDAEQQNDCQGLLSEGYIDSSSSNGKTQNWSPLEDTQRSAALQFSGHVAEAFLSQRWKEAVTGDHVKLVLFPETETVKQQKKCEEEGNKKVSILQNMEEDQMIADEVKSGPSIQETGSDANFRTKQGAGFKKRYVPKIRTGNGT